MNVIIGVLKEELRNSLRMIKRYGQEYDALPKGSLVRKVIKGRVYDYLVFRRKGKVVLKYLGKLSEKERAKYREAKGKRLRYRRLGSDLKRQVIFLRRALRERKRRAL